MEFEQTGLWRRTLGGRAKAGQGQRGRERLKEAYRRFWERGVTLASQIAKDLPSLTLHDERHFEALWQRADLIAGPNYHINPLEAFVLGGAILLHDAGHAVIAYEGGFPEIQRSPQWRDNLTAAL